MPLDLHFRMLISQPSSNSERCTLKMLCLFVCLLMKEIMSFHKMMIWKSLLYLLMGMMPEKAHYPPMQPCQHITTAPSTPLALFLVHADSRYYDEECNICLNQFQVGDRVTWSKQYGKMVSSNSMIMMCSSGSTKMWFLL
jgi:hypothetical protein